MYIIYHDQVENKSKLTPEEIKSGKGKDMVSMENLAVGVFLLNIRVIQIFGVFSKNFRGTLTIFA